MRDHGSIGLFLGNGVFWWELWLWVFGPFPFLFLFSVGRKSRRRTRFWLVIKERGPFQVVVSFLLLGDNSILFRYCLVLRPFYYNLQVFFVCLWILVVSLKIAIRIPCLHFCVEIFLMKGNILVCNVTFLFCFFSCLMIVHTDYFILFDIWINLKCLINGKLIGGGQRIMTRSWNCTVFKGSISN